VWNKRAAAYICCKLVEAAAVMTKEMEEEGESGAAQVRYFHF
jgi:hypothetical protein